MDSSNYKNALRWVDYIVIDENTLSPELLSLISNKLKIPQEELQNILYKGAESSSDSGLQVVTANWI